MRPPSLAFPNEPEPQTVNFDAHPPSPDVRRRPTCLQVFPPLACFHVGCATAAGAASAARGERRWPARAAKAAAVGFLALVEALLLPDQDPTE